MTLARIAWACWAGWAVLVIARVYVRLWESLRHPADLAAILGHALRQSLACAIAGGVILLVAAAMLLAWRAVRAKTGGRAAAPALLAASVLSLVWFRSEGAVVTWLGALHAPHFPALGEAAVRSIRGLCGAAFVALASWTAGHLLLRPIGLARARAEERHVLALTLGAGVLSYASAAMAWVGIYRPPAVALLIAVLLAAGALARVRAGPRDDAAPETEPHAFGWPKPAAIDTMWVALAVLALSFAFVAALAPEIEYDALWYHLELPRVWLAAGRPVDVIQEYPSLYPMTWELVYGAALVMGGAAAAKLLHFGCLLVLAVTVAVAARRHTPASSPYVAAGLLVTAPTLLWEASTAYNDLAIAMFAAVACYALARYAATGQSAWLIASALEFGLAAATKHLGLVALAVAAALLLWASHRGRVPWRRTVHAIFVVGLATLVLALPWYARAWRGSGNPFFPELYGLFGGGPAARWDALAARGLSAFKAHFGRGHDAAALLRLPWDVTVHAALFGGSFGPLWLMLVPACFIGARRSRGALGLALGALVYILVWASPVSSLQLRFLVPIGGALALVAADGWQRVIMSSAVGLAWRRAAAGALLAVACLSLPPFTTLQETDRHEYAGWLTHVLRTAPVGVVTGREREAQYFAEALPSWAVWQYANTHLPADAAVLTFTAGDNFYSRRTRFPYDSVLARPAVWTAATDADVLAAMRALGAEFVIFDRRLLPRLQAEHLPIAGEAIQRACATLYSDRRYRLCRLTSVLGAMPRRPAAAAPLP